MTAACQLCGVTIIGPSRASIHQLEPDSPEGMVVDYDALAAHMWKHLSDFHPDQMHEGIMVQHRAAKMYAMNWATVPGELESVRIQHRQTLLLSLTVTTQFQTAAPDPSGSSDPDSPEGSKEKKLSRKVSN